VLVRARPGAPKNALKLFKYMSKKIILALCTVLSLAACENKTEEKVHNDEKNSHSETHSEHHQKPAEESKKDVHSSEAAKPADSHPAESNSAHEVANTVQSAEEHKSE
jgi:uncharacterized lipoprotein